jgi:hypothetical protein
VVGLLTPFCFVNTGVKSLVTVMFCGDADRGNVPAQEPAPLFVSTPMTSSVAVEVTVSVVV